MSDRRCSLLEELWDVSESFKRFVDINRWSYLTVRSSVVHRHHVWGGKTRVDLPSNLLDLCAVVHIFVHDVRPIEGRIACIWAASRRDGFDWGELNAVAGLNVIGWVESHPVEEEPFCTMRAEIISSMEASDAGADAEAE